MLSVAVEPMIEGEYDEQRCQTFTLFTLGMLAMISIIVNCLPITPLVLFFSPATSRSYSGKDANICTCALTA